MSQSRLSICCYETKRCKVGNAKQRRVSFRSSTPTFSNFPRCVQTDGPDGSGSKLTPARSCDASIAAGSLNASVRNLALLWLNFEPLLFSKIWTCGTQSFPTDGIFQWMRRIFFLQHIGYMLSCSECSWGNFTHISSASLVVIANASQRLTEPIFLKHRLHIFLSSRIIQRSWQDSVASLISSFVSRKIMFPQ